MKFLVRSLIAWLALAASAQAEVPVYRGQQLEVPTVAVSQRTATVVARGELTIACVALEEPGVVRKDKTFYVVLAETPIDPLALCMPFVAVTKFTQDVQLDLNGLAPGEYRVIVNGIENRFTLN
jgi:hypothetical protein